MVEIGTLDSGGTCFGIGLGQVASPVQGAPGSETRISPISTKA